MHAHKRSLRTMKMVKTIYMLPIMFETEHINLEIDELIDETAGFTGKKILWNII